MTGEELTLKRDRMRFTKDKRSSSLVLLAIVFDALYFVSLYRADVGSFYYTWKIGASIVYNLLFMLTAFLCSEGVKNRKGGYWAVLIFIGLMQVVRMFYLPAQAVAATVAVAGTEMPAMERGQYVYLLVCLGISAACCVAAAVNSYINGKHLAAHYAAMEANA